MTSSDVLGPVVIIGGAEDRRGEAAILRQFVALAGGQDARIAILAAASTRWREVGDQYVEAFTRLGAGHAQLCEVWTRQDASEPAAVEGIGEATAVFFTGGDQGRIMRLLAGTAVEEVLHTRHAEGMVVGGTSAGAAIMPGTMIAGGMPQAPLRIGSVEVSAGMGFVSGILVDQHFEQRGRLRRLLSAVAQYPHFVGLGIDENTAVIVRGDQCESAGAGTVTVVDAGSLKYTNLSEIREEESLALFGIQLHILVDGCRFDLSARLPAPPRGTVWGDGMTDARS